MLPRLVCVSVLFAYALATQTSYLECTESIHYLVDNAYDVVNSAFKNEFVPDKSTIYGLIDGVQLVALECGKKNIDLEPYKPCIDRLYPVLAELEDLVYSVKNEDYKNILKDIIKIALDMVNGVTYCSNI